MTRQSIKTKYKRQQTKNKFLAVYFLGVLALIAPLLHIEASNEKNLWLKEMTTFLSWRKLLFATGFPLAILFIGTILYIIRKHLSDESLRKPITLLCYGIFILSFFFIIWDIHPTIQDYAPWMYRLGSLIIAIVLTISYKYFVQYIENKESRYKRMTKSLFKTINQIKEKVLLPAQKKEAIEIIYKDVEKL